MDSDNHLRTIVYIDLDCFYEQVDTFKNSALETQQKYIVRDYAINNCVQVSEALKLRPKTEKPHDYRVMSTKVCALINKFTPCVEKVGLVGFFIDVSELVKNRLQVNLDVKAIGHIYGAEECECGCFERLNIGSVIASEIRENIETELGLTSCAGIAHNKLLAELVGDVKTPNQQTIMYPSNAAQLLFSLPDLKAIPGIKYYADVLQTINIATIEDLRLCSMDTLQKTIGVINAKKLMDFSYGRDVSPVIPTERPPTIGLDDNFRSVSVEKNVRDKFLQLLHRLMIRVMVDGRIPRTVKITLRKYDKQRKSTHREQRQLNISPSLFTVANTVNLTQYGEEKLMGIIMTLFHKLVDITKPYHVTLLGLGFTKFQERQNAKNCVASLLMNNISVQSVTCLQNGSQPHRETIQMDYSPMSHKLDVNTDGSESEIEPSPKKAKFSSLMAKRRCFGSSLECQSPSKLRVAELRLNSREFDKSPDDDQCSDVFKELAQDVKIGLLQQWNK